MLLNQITQQLKALNLDLASTSCIDKTCIQNTDTVTESSDSEESEEEENFIHKLAQNFEDSSLAINKICYESTSATRN